MIPGGQIPGGPVNQGIITKIDNLLLNANNLFSGMLCFRCELCSGFTGVNFEKLLLAFES
jgi:hypothetical protein